jgi:hypothetical protein
MGKLKVLFIEDYDDLIRIYKRAFGEMVEMIIASTLQEAEVLFFQHKDSLDAIVTDACLHRHVPDTPPLIRKIREVGFTRFILGVSGRDSYLIDLKAAGCDEVLEKNGKAFIDEITEIFVREQAKKS